MVVEILATAALVALATGWMRDHRRLMARAADDDASRSLPVDLALWWIEQEAHGAELRSSRRIVARIRVLGRLAMADTASTTGAALAAALPPGALRDSTLTLPHAARDALTFRHARWDGGGVPCAKAGAAIPLSAQILAVAEWMEGRDGASPSSLDAGLREEAGHRFSPALAHNAAANLRELLAVAPPDAHLGLKVTSGTLVCVTADGLDGHAEAARTATMSEIERRVRATLRPSDRVYRTDRDVVIWLPHTGPEGAMAATARMQPALDAVPVAGTVGVTVSCSATFALADTDATSFADLLAVARERAVAPMLVAKAG